MVMTYSHAIALPDSNAVDKTLEMGQELLKLNCHYSLTGMFIH